MNMNWQNFDYFTTSFQTSFNSIGDTFVRNKKSTTVNGKVETKTPAKKKPKGNTKGCFNSWAEIESYVHKVQFNGKEVNVLNVRSFNQASPEWQEQLNYLIDAAEELGYTLVFNEIGRSCEVSKQACAQKGTVVANAGKSPHNFGVGADIVLFDKKGNAIPIGKAGYQRFAELVKAKSGGKITWGGDWSGTRTLNGRCVSTCDAEAHHFELKGWQALRDNGTLTCIP